MNRITAEQIRIWVEKISESDKTAFDRLFRVFYPRLVRFAFRYTRNKAVASDLVQDVFVFLWEKRRELNPKQSTKAYLYAMVQNKALNYVRDHSGETLGLESQSDHLTKTDDRIDRQDESKKIVDLLKVWIEELPKRQREAFKLSRFEGLNHDEIADLMGISSHTVNNHIMAALHSLRDCYDTYQKKQIQSERQ